MPKSYPTRYSIPSNKIILNMNKNNYQNEIESLREIFSKNEEKISQLNHREEFLQSKIKGDTP